MTQPSDEKSASETMPAASASKKIGDKLLHTLRTGQAMSVRAGKSKGAQGWPKPRRPSLPPTPWDKDTS